MMRPVSDFLPGPFPTPAQRAEGAAMLAALLARPLRGTDARNTESKPTPRPSPWTLSRDDLRRFDMPVMPTAWELPNLLPTGPSYFGVDRLRGRSAGGLSVDEVARASGIRVMRSPFDDTIRFTLETRPGTYRQ